MYKIINTPIYLNLRLLRKKFIKKKIKHKYILQKICEIDWQFSDFGIVELLNILEEFGVAWGNEVYSDSFSAKSASSSDSMNVSFFGDGHIIIDDQ